MFKRPARRQTYEDFVTPARQHEYDGARDMDDARVRSSWPGCQLSLEQRGSPAVTEACLRAPSPGIDLDQSSGSGASRAAGLMSPVGPEADFEPDRLSFFIRGAKC